MLNLHLKSTTKELLDFENTLTITSFICDNFRELEKKCVSMNVNSGIFILRI